MTSRCVPQATKVAVCSHGATSNGASSSSVADTSEPSVSQSLRRSLPWDPLHLCELDFDRYAVLAPPGCYLNHSCDPNAMRHGVVVFAWTRHQPRRRDHHRLPPQRLRRRQLAVSLRRFLLHGRCGGQLLRHVAGSPAAAAPSRAAVHPARLQTARRTPVTSGRCVIRSMTDRPSVPLSRGRSPRPPTARARA